MDKEKRLALMIRGMEDTPKHYIVVCEVLGELDRHLRAEHIHIVDDQRWLKHILVPDNDGRLISLFCGGLRKTIDIQQLNKSGLADTRYKEVSFQTPKGATNYIKKLLGLLHNKSKEARE